jgi:rod shape-determining protein MreC
VAFRDGPLTDWKVPLTWGAAIAVVIATVIVVALLLGDRRETVQGQAYGVTKNVVDTVSQPVSGAIAAPGRWTGGGLNALRDYIFAGQENRHLREEISELKSWHDRAIALQSQNDRYRSLLGLQTDPPIPMVTAQLVTDSRGPFANTRLANAGAEHGIIVGNPVMAEHGLVGRIVGVAHNASRVLLLTDIVSRTPVLVARTNARAILTGDGGPNPKLAYMRGENPVKVGDRVLTSGDGGVFPRGLPVGIAVQGLDGTWRVKLDSDNAPIDYVRIFLFKDFAQLADQKALAAAAMPPPTPAEAAAVSQILKDAAAAPPPASSSSAKPAAIAPAPGKPTATAAAPAAAKAPDKPAAKAKAKPGGPKPAGHTPAAAPKPTDGGAPTDGDPR